MPEKIDLSKRPILKTKEDYDQFYTNGGFKYDRETTEKFMVDMVRLPYVASLFKHKPTILDVGCGDGLLSGIFSKWFTTTGIDQSEAGVRIALQKYPGITFRTGDVLKLTEKYDVVYNRACCVTNYPVDSEEFRLNTFDLVSLADRFYYFSEWTRQDYFNTYDGRWHYKNPDDVTRELKKYGAVFTFYDPKICNFVARLEKI